MGTCRMKRRPITKGKGTRRGTSPLTPRRPTIPVVMTDEMARNLTRHDMAIDGDSLFKCLYFVRGCAREAARDPTSKGTFYLEELTRVLASVYANLVLGGNVKLAGLLPTILDVLTSAYRKYGKTVRIMPKQNTLHNRFVAYLCQGRLWNEGRVVPCNLGPKKLPPKEDRKAWRLLIVRFLRRTFGRSPTDDHAVLGRRCKIDVFDSLLRSQHARKYVREDKKIPLIEASPSEQWKAIEDAIEQAIETMHKR